MGQCEREFTIRTTKEYLAPLKAYLEGDMKTIAVGHSSPQHIYLLFTQIQVAACVDLFLIFTLVIASSSSLLPLHPLPLSSTSPLYRLFSPSPSIVFSLLPLSSFLSFPLSSFLSFPPLYRLFSLSPIVFSLLLYLLFSPSPYLLFSSLHLYSFCSFSRIFSLLPPSLSLPFTLPLSS